MVLDITTTSMVVALTAVAVTVAFVKWCWRRTKTSETVVEEEEEEEEYREEKIVYTLNRTVEEEVTKQATETTSAELEYKSIIERLQEIADTNHHGVNETKVPPIDVGQDDEEEDDSEEEELDDSEEEEDDEVAVVTTETIEYRVGENPLIHEHIRNHDREDGLQKVTIETIPYTGRVNNHDTTDLQDGESDDDSDDYDDDDSDGIPDVTKETIHYKGRTTPIKSEQLSDDIHYGGRVADVIRPDLEDEDNHYGGQISDVIQTPVEDKNNDDESDEGISRSEEEVLDEESESDDEVRHYDNDDEEEPALLSLKDKRLLIESLLDRQSHSKPPKAIRKTVRAHSMHVHPGHHGGVTYTGLPVPVRYLNKKSNNNNNNTEPKITNNNNAAPDRTKNSTLTKQNSDEDFNSVHRKSELLQSFRRATPPQMKSRISKRISPQKD